jgi:predicted nucleic acid-binding protein
VTVISDTSAITNLAAIHNLQLLLQLYSQVMIPEAVYRELADIEPPVQELSKFRGLLGWKLER